MIRAGSLDGHRTRLAGVIGGVLAINILAWGTLILGSGHSGGAVLGAGMVAFTLGARHAFDADHIAVIDDCTRLAVRQGHRRVGMGFSFALGHSSVVMLLTLSVLWVASAAVNSWAARWQEVGSPFVQGFAALFLLLVGVLNLRVLFALVAGRRQSQDEHGSDVVEEALARRGVFSRFLGTQAQAAVASSWRLFPIGFLFGLGLETASEVSLLAVAASSAASGAESLPALLALPLLFAGGMVLFDTANSLLVSRLYWTTERTDDRRLRFNMAMTAATAIAGLGIGLVYLTGLLTEVSPLRGLSVIASVADHFEMVGFLMVGSYLLAWIVTFAPTQRRTGVELPMGVAVSGVRANGID